MKSFFGPYFEGLRDSKDRSPLMVSPIHVRGYVDGMSREQLSQISRYLYDNVGIVSYAVETIVNYAVPVIPQAATEDDVWNDAAERVFAAWEPMADYTGRFDFETLQRMVARAIPIDGDIGALMTDEAGFPQIQLLEGWRFRDGDGKSNDGVVTDSMGRVTGYVIEEGTTYRTIPADQCILLYEPERVGNYRGLTPIRRGMNDVRDIGDLKALEKLAQKVRASVPAVLETQGGVEENVWGDDVGNAPTSESTAQERKMSLAELLGGDIPTLSPGEKLNVLSGDRSAQPATDFMTVLTGYFVYGLGIPPAFFLDERLTGPNTRSVNGKAQRAFNNHRRTSKRFALWAWRRVIGAAIASGELPSHPQWANVSYQSPANISIDTGDEDRADTEGVLNGTRTRQEVWGKRGKAWDTGTKQVFREQRAIIQWAKELAAELGVPIEVVLTAHGFEFPKAQPTQADKPQPPKA